MTFRKFVEGLIKDNVAGIVRDQITCDEIPGRIKTEEVGGNRPLFFENIADYPQTIVANVFASQQLINRAIAAEDTQSFFSRIESAINTPKRLVLQKLNKAEYIITPNPDLRHHLALINHSQEDATPYLTSSVVLARNPDSERHHLCFVRLSIQKLNMILFNPSTPRIKEITANTVERGLSLDVVILIGAPPAVMLLGAHSLPDNVDELEVAQALAGDSLGFFKGNLPVPVSTELILFGQVLPEYKQEGPFGDFKGLYSVRHNPICVISELWQRNNPLFHVILGGTSREHIELLTLKAKHRLEKLKAHLPHLINYKFPIFAGGRLCLLTMAKGFSLDTFLTDLFNIPLVKCYILISEDTNPQCSDDVLWALTHRTDGHGDFNFQDIDPLVGPVGKVVIDATAEDFADWNNRRIQVFKKPIIRNEL